MAVFISLITVAEANPIKNVFNLSTITLINYENYFQITNLTLVEDVVVEHLDMVVVVDTTAPEGIIVIVVAPTSTTCAEKKLL